MHSKIDLSLSGRPAEPIPRFKAPSLRQMAYLESRLVFIAEHCHWYGLSMTPREWGELLVAAWRKEYPAPGITGGVAFIGGNYRSLTDVQCSEVITIADELLASIGLSQDDPPAFPVNLKQDGDCLSDLVVTEARRPTKERASRISRNKRAPSPWSGVNRRARLPRIFDYDDLSHETIQKSGDDQ